MTNLSDQQIHEIENDEKLDVIGRQKIKVSDSDYIHLSGKLLRMAAQQSKNSCLRVALSFFLLLSVFIIVLLALLGFGGDGRKAADGETALLAEKINENLHNNFSEIRIIEYDIQNMTLINDKIRSLLRSIEYCHLIMKDGFPDNVKGCGNNIPSFINGYSIGKNSYQPVSLKISSSESDLNKKKVNILEVTVPEYESVNDYLSTSQTCIAMYSEIVDNNLGNNQNELIKLHSIGKEKEFYNSLKNCLSVVMEAHVVKIDKMNNKIKDLRESLISSIAFFSSDNYYTINNIPLRYAVVFAFIAISTFITRYISRDLIFCAFSGMFSLGVFALQENNERSSELISDFIEISGK